MYQLQLVSPSLLLLLSLLSDIGLAVRVFANGPEDLGSIPGRVIPKTHASLLNTQHYKVRIKGKVEQSREMSSAPPLHLGVVAIKKGAFGSPSTMVTNFTYYYTIQEFFTLALAEDLLQEFVWQQVFSSLQDTSRYSGQS